MHTYASQGYDEELYRESHDICMLNNQSIYNLNSLAATSNSRTNVMETLAQDRSNKHPANRH